jgi:hypothetical protein
VQNKSEQETKVSNWPELLDMSMFEQGHGAMTAIVDEIAGEMDLPSSQVLALVRRLSGRKRELAGEITTTVLMEAVLRSPKVLTEIDRRRGVVAVAAPTNAEVDECSLMEKLSKVIKDQAETNEKILDALRSQRITRKHVEEIQREAREDLQQTMELCRMLEVF